MAGFHKNILNLPNALTALRMALIPVFILLFWHDQYLWALIFFLFAGFSDFIDGILARHLHQKTALGAALDPAADKLLMMVSFIILAIKGVVPLWLTLLVIGRDVYIVLGLLFLKLKRCPIVLRPTLLSKWNTFFELLFLLGVFVYFAWAPGGSWAEYFRSALQFLGWLIAGTVVLSALQYTKVGWSLYRPEQA